MSSYEWELIGAHPDRGDGGGWPPRHHQRHPPLVECAWAWRLHDAPAEAVACGTDMVMEIPFTRSSLEGLKAHELCEAGSMTSSTTRIPTVGCSRAWNTLQAQHLGISYMLP